MKYYLISLIWLKAKLAGKWYFCFSLDSISLIAGIYGKTYSLPKRKTHRQRSCTINSPRMPNRRQEELAGRRLWMGWRGWKGEHWQRKYLGRVQTFASNGPCSRHTRSAVRSRALPGEAGEASTTPAAAPLHGGLGSNWGRRVEMFGRSASCRVAGLALLSLLFVKNWSGIALARWLVPYLGIAQMSRITFCLTFRNPCRKRSVLHEVFWNGLHAIRYFLGSPAKINFINKFQ